MKSSFKSDFVKLYQNERGIIVLMILNLLLALVFFVFSLIHLNPNAAVVKIGYGDIGGYRDGSWLDMLAFPLLFLTFGILHGILTVRIFHKRGGGMAKFFLITTTMLILGSFLALIRLLGEG
ncbi:hypothetical protein J5491_00570 [Candidatus Saccharibacteria bacterium]|nr:hypothetical protein [Candidatus Saccharibacteria bacterium]